MQTIPGHAAIITAPQSAKIGNINFTRLGWSNGKIEYLGTGIAGAGIDPSCSAIFRKEIPAGIIIDKYSIYIFRIALHINRESDSNARRSPRTGN